MFALIIKFKNFFNKSDAFSREKAPEKLDNYSDAEKLRLKNRLLRNVFNVFKENSIFNGKNNYGEKNRRK